MSTHSTEWPTGTPCWVDLSTSDQERARAFYTGLFGWDYNIQPPEFGGYGVAMVNSSSAAGIGGKMDADQPSAWTTYLATDDAETTAEKVVAAGGTILAPPMQVGPMGTMCIATDPTGAAFGVWQADQMIGAEVVNEAGGIIWNQQVSRDWEAAKAFYADVFGLSAQVLPDAPEVAFNTLHLGEAPVGGIGAMDEGSPAEMPAHWLAYFAVLDTDATVERAVELGGGVREPAVDTPYGRQAVLTGPEGELFAVMSTPPEGNQTSTDGAG